MTKKLVWIWKEKMVEKIAQKKMEKNEKKLAKLGTKFKILFKTKKSDYLCICISKKSLKRRGCKFFVAPSLGLSKSTTACENQP